MFAVKTHLYVDRAHFRATLKKNGKVIFTTIVGVGRSIWPTPRGEFYIRDKLTNFNDPFYGPLRSGRARISDAHRLAGRRLRRRSRHERARDPSRPRLPRLHPHAELVDLKLARLMPVGTPPAIT